ncbi:UNVERIFIED_CONTAM: hypothetical protein GTU68_052839 [Idotea baltica]|nr:hypothetical protein [Idotea baltica]
MSSSDPLCILYIKDSGSQSYYEVGRTEQVKDSLNPQWVKRFELDYRFEERQVLKFHVYDWDTKSSNPKDQDSLGEVECSLGEIMACQGSQLKRSLPKGGGTLVVSGEELSKSKEILTLDMSAVDLDKKDFMGKSDPFLVFSRSLQNNTFSVIHKTEVIKNNLNPVWKPIVIPVKALCGDDEQRIIKIECFDYDSDGSHDLIGECQTKLATLREGSGPTNNYTLINPKKQQKKSSYKGSGKLILNKFSCRIEPTFLDYIQGGLQIHFTVAVDFTASNGDPRDSNSLHFRQVGVDNQYSLAIKAVGNIIQDYDSGRRIF